MRRIRDGIAAETEALAELFPKSLVRSRADSISCEILPLAEACRFLELEAERILAPRLLRTAARPFWLRRVGVEIRREPWGLTLIIAPANYPLFLAGVQMMQAVVAGNAVVVKPGRGGGPILNRLAELAFEAGISRELITVLDEQVDSAIEAIDRGVDKIVMTGSVASGRAVLRRAAEHITPAVLELSGNDALFVQESADLVRAARSVAFGVQLNGGDTCIAPRRIFVHCAVADEFRALLRELEEQAGARWRQVEMVVVSNDTEALTLAGDNPHALGAAIFGQECEAKRLAGKIRAGVVVINDVIVPTADPRVPFGGRGLSGFGSTRGEQGLLEMTTPKAIVVQRARRLRHLEAVPRNPEELFAAYMLAAHSSGWTKRLAAWRNLVRAAYRLREKNG